MCFGQLLIEQQVKKICIILTIKQQLLNYLIWFEKITSNIGI